MTWNPAGKDTQSQLYLRTLVAPSPVTGTALTCCSHGTTWLCSCYMFTSGNRSPCSLLAAPQATPLRIKLLFCSSLNYVCNNVQVQFPSKLCVSKTKMFHAVPHPSSSLFLCSLIEQPHSRRTMAPSDQEPGQFKEQAATSKPRMVTSCTLGTATATFALLPEPKS